MSAIFSLTEASNILLAVPGAEDADVRVVDNGEGPFVGINWRDYAALVARVPLCPVPYTPRLFACAHIALWSVAHINALFAVNCLAAGTNGTVASSQLLHGRLGGMVPVDPGMFQAGEDAEHDLCWFIDENKKFWLYGAQSRQVMDASHVAQIKSVDEFIING